MSSLPRSESVERAAADTDKLDLRMTVPGQT